jgi:hypothetical protein
MGDTNISVGTPEGNRSLGDIDVDGRIVFKWIIGDVINTEYRNML